MQSKLTSHIIWANLLIGIILTLTTGLFRISSDPMPDYPPYGFFTINNSMSLAWPWMSTVDPQRLENFNTKLESASPFIKSLPHGQPDFPYESFIQGFPFPYHLQSIGGFGVQDGGSPWAFIYNLITYTAVSFIILWIILGTKRLMRKQTKSF